MKPAITTLLVLLLLPAFVLPQSARTELTSFVDPFVGTGGHGHTFPGATLPFGMVQLSPDTRLSGWDGCSGYHYSDHIINGFSHTHLSGTGISDYGDILLMPTVGEIHFESNVGVPDKGYASEFSHKTKSRAGYYSVKLDDDKILAELTTTNRVGFIATHFPSQSCQHHSRSFASRSRIRVSVFTSSTVPTSPAFADPKPGPKIRSFISSWSFPSHS